MEQHITLYHTSFQEIRQPDLQHGRKNADLGQGFYLTDSEAFAKRWAKLRSHTDTFLNTYELDLSDLTVLRLERDERWFHYILKNRAGYADSETADVILGPIANDTIYDTYGVMTSGLLSADDSLQLLSLGPQYRQVVMKTEKALANLTFVSAEVLQEAEILASQQQTRQEEKAYQEAFLAYLRSTPRLSHIIDLLT